jgi:TrmH family RNA methyltransferase
MLRITSSANPRIRRLMKLREPATRRRSGLFLIESERDLGRALDAGHEILELYLADDYPLDGEVVGRAEQAGAERIRLTPRLCGRVSYRQNPRGLVAVMGARSMTLGDLPVDRPGLCLVCSGIEKPGNVGAMLRSADAVAADAVLIDRADADVFNPHCIRASTGAVFSTPIACAAAEELAAWLNERQVQVVAASPDAPQAYTRADWSQPGAIVMGAEDTGLDDFWRSRADVMVAVPMFGRVDSLNVSVTAALLLFEARRQRCWDAGTADAGAQ